MRVGECTTDTERITVEDRYNNGYDLGIVRKVQHLIAREWKQIICSCP